MPHTTSKVSAEPIPSLLGARVRQLRRATGLTVEQLAQLVDVDKAHISRIENNRRQPSVAMLAQIARALETSIGHLLGESLDKAEIKVVRANAIEAGPAMSVEPGGHRIIALRNGQTKSAFETFMLYPGKDPGANEARHPGHEMLYVLHGAIEVMFHEHAITLKRGDCIHFPGYLHHRLRQVGRAKSAALLVLSNL